MTLASSFGQTWQFGILNHLDINLKCRKIDSHQSILEYGAPPTTMIGQLGKPYYFCHLWASNSMRFYRSPDFQAAERANFQSFML